MAGRYDIFCYIRPVDPFIALMVGIMMTYRSTNLCHVGNHVSMAEQE